jgi:hypothetical protein
MKSPKRSEHKATACGTFNFPAVDSILYAPNEVLTCIQIKKTPYSCLSGVLKAGSNVIHRLRVTAFQKTGRGAS